ncbi:MAG: flagellar hook-length control protein FliK [Pseudomonadota bacterium]
MEFVSVKQIASNLAQVSKRVGEGAAPLVPFDQLLQLESDKRPPIETAKTETAKADHGSDRPVKTKTDRPTRTADSQERKEKAKDSDEGNAFVAAESKPASLDEVEETGAAENKAKINNPMDVEAPIEQSTTPDGDINLSGLAATPSEAHPEHPDAPAIPAGLILTNWPPAADRLQGIAEAIEGHGKANPLAQAIRATGDIQTPLGLQRLMAEGAALPSTVAAADPRLTGKEAMLPQDGEDGLPDNAFAFTGNGKPDVLAKFRQEKVLIGQPAFDAAKTLFHPIPANPNGPIPLAAGMHAVPTNVAASVMTETSTESLLPPNMTSEAARRPIAIAATATAERTATPPPVMTDQIALHLKRAAADGLDRIRIQLKPASLGHIDVKMEVGKDGKVTAVVSVERPETLDLLQRDARTLERALQDSGLRADSNSLHFQLRGEGNGRTPTGAEGADSSSVKDSDPAVTDTETTALENYNYWVVGDGFVDIRV